VQLDTACIADGYDYDAALFVGRRRGGRGRRLGVGAVLDDADMGDVRLLQLALVVNLGEAALCDSAALVVEALGAGHG
jgi:hypothetical protein